MNVRPMSCLAVAVLVVGACAGERGPLPVDAPTFDVRAASVVSGRVLGPDGNICNSLPAGSRVIVIAIDAGGRPVPGAQQLDCPTNTFAFSLNPGSYRFRAQLPADGAVTAGLPLRWITVPPVEVGEGEVTRDITFEQGRGFGGGATIDGQPLEQMSLILAYPDANVTATSATSGGSDGAWNEFFGRSPPLLQPGIQLVPSILCDALGARLVTQPLRSGIPFTFPDEADGTSCGFTLSEAVQFSHDRTRVVVTPGPGDVGATQRALPEPLGNGWGVQFPVNPGEQPTHGLIAISHLFMGGLIVGIRPDRLLSGNDINGYVRCSPVCRDFGLDARLNYNASATGTRVTWHYSDATSSEGVGLKVVQKSYDGEPPADYVLFRFAFTNSSATPVTFYPGMFADWDIDDDFLDDVGATEMDGRLMYITNAAGGIAGGTLIVSDAPVSGNAFFDEFDQTTEQVVDALAGDFSAPTTGFPSDYRYVQAVGPIALASQDAATMWIAIVAGEDLPQLRANAAAASADIARRRTQPERADGVTAAPAISGKAGTNAAARRSTINPACKRGCGSLQ